MVIVRPATDQDRQAIRRLVSLYPQQLLQTLTPKTLDFFVAEDRGEVVGCCALEVYSKRLAEVRSLAVEKKYQSQGIGKRLVIECLKKAKQLKIREVLTITNAVVLFERLGFRTFNKQKIALFKTLR